jgi:Coenzyme PQQ synthesis protein D (PqqD)
MPYSNSMSASGAESHYPKTLAKKSRQGVKFRAMLSFLKNRLAGIARRKSNSGCLGFCIAPDVKASLHAEGVVLINLRKGTVFSANRVGAMIWNAAAERWSLERVAQSMSQAFHIPAEAAQEDAAEFLAQLASEGLLIPDVL